MRDYVAEALYERDCLGRQLLQRETAVNNLSKTVAEARDAPISWAARVLWLRYFPTLLQGAVLLAIGALAWFGFRPK